MHLSKALRRFVAGTVAVLFLACQGMAIVYSRSLDAPGSNAAAASSPCHDPGSQAGNTAGSYSCPSDCQSLISATSPSGAGFFDVTDLPALTARLKPVAAVAGLALPDEPLLLIEPPPHSILHCCLRN